MQLMKHPTLLKVRNQNMNYKNNFNPDRKLRKVRVTKKLVPWIYQ